MRFYEIFLEKLNLFILNSFRFYPIDKSVYKKPYEPLMLTSTKFGAPKYGTQYFRDESNPNELISGVRLNLKKKIFYIFNFWLNFFLKRFKTVIPPIPEFQKLNKTYVKAHYYLS